MPKIKFAKKFWGQLDSVTAYVYNRITQNSVMAKGEKIMAGEFGAYIAQKRVEKDVKLKPIAEKLGVSVTYLSDIIKGRRNPPDIDGLAALADALNLDEEERDEMFDLAGRERNQVSPDLPEYIMGEDIPTARVALRRARNSNLGDDFWQEVNQIIDRRNGGN